MASAKMPRSVLRAFSTFAEPSAHARASAQAASWRAARAAGHGLQRELAQGHIKHRVQAMDMFRKDSAIWVASVAGRGREELGTDPGRALAASQCGWAREQQHCTPARRRASAGTGASSGRRYLHKSHAQGSARKTCLLERASASGSATRRAAARRTPPARMLHCRPGASVMHAGGAAMKHPHLKLRARHPT
jgi:hypothetical protein